MDIIEALRKLDVDNDNHWTSDGLPRLDTVKMIASNPSISRMDIDAVAAGFNRSNADTWQPVKSETQETGETNPTSNNQPPTTEYVQEPVKQSEAGSGDGQPTKQDDTQAEQGVSLEELEATLEAAVARADAARQAKDAAEVEFREAIAAEDAAREAVRAAQPVEEQGNVIQAYLQAQIKANQERAEIAARLAEAGITVKSVEDVQFASKLDEALAKGKK